VSLTNISIKHFRCFEDTNITHVSTKIDPIDDIETINLELQLADLESLNNKKSSIEKNQMQYLI